MNSHRRLLLAALVSGGLGAPFAAVAQQPGRTLRVGLLATQSRPSDADFPRSVYAAFQQGMRELGHVEGRNLTIEWRFAGGDLARLPELAAQLVGIKVDVLVAGGTDAPLALQQATATIPIVMMLVILNPLFQQQRHEIARLAADHRLPSMTAARIYTEAGCLLSYGSNIPEEFRRAGFYVDKIFKGAKPADLPVEQPTRFELVINGKTAKALGLTIPQSLLIQCGQGDRMKRRGLA